MKIIGVRRAQSGHWKACLRPGGRIKTVRMHDPANLPKRPVQHQMGRRVRTGLELPFDDLAGVQGYNHHVPGFHLVITHSRWLNYHQALVTINATGVAPGLYHQPLAHKVEVGLANLLL